MPGTAEIAYLFAQAQQIPLLGFGGGGLVSFNSKPPFFMQAGTANLTTDSSGLFPGISIHPFPNGVLAAFANGTWGTRTCIFQVSSATTLSSLVFQAFDPSVPGGLTGLAGAQINFAWFVIGN
jgi:hypothetical protein